MSTFIIKEPSKYEYQKSLDSIHSQQITCLERLSNGNLATGSLDTSVKIWDANSNKILRVFNGHTHHILQIVELHSGNIATSSMDRTINIWDRQTAEIIFTLEGFINDIKRIDEVDTERLVILTQNDPSFSIWSYQKEGDKNCRYLSDHDEKVNSVIVVANKYLFSASSDKTIKRWSVQKNHSSCTYIGHTDSVLCLAFLDEKLFASGSGDKSIKVWDIMNKK